MTPNQYFDLLVRDLPDTLPPGAGQSVEEALQNAQRLMTADPEVGPDLQVYLGDSYLTPRRQCRAILVNMATAAIGAAWNGPQAVYDAARVQEGDFDPSALGTERLAAASVFPLVRAAYPQLLAPHVALVQPVDRPTRMGGDGDSPRFGAPAFYLERLLAQEGAFGFAGTVGMTRLRRSMLPLTDLSLSILSSREGERDLKEYHGANAAQEILCAVSREAALELNLSVLSLLLESAGGGNHLLECPGVERPYAATVAVGAADQRLFAQCHGTATHLFAGPAAFDRLFGKQRSSSETLAGLTSFEAEGCSNYRVALWGHERANTVLLVRARPWDFEAPIAYLPHLWTIGSETLGAGEQATVRRVVRHQAALAVVEPAYCVRVDLE